LTASLQAKGQLPPLEILPVKRNELQTAELSWQALYDAPVHHTQLELEIQSPHFITEEQGVE